MRPRPAGAWVAVLVAGAMAAALSACGGLPTDSAVQQGSPVGEAAVQAVRAQPDGPAAGATPDQVVRGFLRAGAGAGFDDDHATARSFFTPNVKDEWLPDSGVHVYGDDSALKVELLTPTTVRVTTSVVAELDRLGRYRERPAGTSVQATFGMQKLDVGWRISVPQKGFGLWLSASDLDRIYRPFTIAYVSRSAPAIVGDRRWFPITPGLATTLARAQLAPIPGYLTGAVQTGIPPGTALAVDAVPSQSGRAVVDLSAAARSADPDLRRAMWAQFVTTLMQVESVTEVSLEVRGAGLDLPDTPDRVSVLSTLGYQSDSAVPAKTALLRTADELSRVSSDRPPDQDPRKPSQPPDGSVLAQIPAAWVSLALSWDGQEIAGIGGDHGDLARWQGSRMFQPATFGSRLTKPSYDSLNGLWVAGEAGGAARVWVIDTSLSPMAKAKPRAISAPWLAGRAVLACRVARDNQRVALITSNRAGGDEQVVVAGIVRSASGVALSLAAEPLRVGWTLTAETDVAWVDDSTLAVVGRASPKDAVGPQLVEIGGRATALSPVAGARLITSTGGLRGVVVTTDRGKVLARSGNGWQELQTGTDFLIPGQ
jgi:Lipoprotein LpqB beta-propeller domain/Sporulation and spore germination